jgi:kinesin family member 6/9
MWALRSQVGLQPWRSWLALTVSVLCRYINNQREEFKFVFNGVLPSDCTQEEVFTRVCKPAVDVSLDGINSTIFAYGQTGSGKTFTVTGGPEKYSGTFVTSGFSADDCTEPACDVAEHGHQLLGQHEPHECGSCCADRGLIPRAISHMFKLISSRGDFMYTVHISYMEIYNNCAFDLLDPTRDVQELSDLPHVTIMEDDEGRYHMRNLSTHRPAPAQFCLTSACLHPVAAGMCVPQHQPWVEAGAKTRIMACAGHRPRRRH